MSSASTPSESASGEVAPGISEGVAMAEFDPLTGTDANQAERLARGATLQQGAQILRLGGGFLVVTVLAHRLTLSALGTYTILLSMIAYVAFVKSSVMSAAIIGVARAVGEGRPDRLNVVVSTGLLIYLMIGVISGAALAGIGLAVLPLLNIPRVLYHQAQLGVVGLAVATTLSWPVQIFDDLLRGLQRFAAVSSLEIFAMVTYVAGALAMAFGGAPVWALVTWNAAIPLLMGVACLVALPKLGVRVQPAPRLVTRAEARRFGSFSGLLVVGGVADLATYSIDRFVLSAIRSPALVGRYEGPLGAQNLIRYFNGTLCAPVMPIAGTFMAAGATDRVRELFLRGLRYSCAATVPLAVVVIVYGAPVLQLWLGSRFASAGTAASVFSAWWLIGANSGLISTILLAAGRVKRTVAGSWIGAVINVTLVVALTGSLGLYGPIVASVTAYAIALAYVFRAGMREADADWRACVRRAWIPSYTTAAGLAGVLLALRWGAHLTSKPATAAIVILAPLAYWAVFAAVWLDGEERHLALYALRLRRARAG